MSTTPFDLARQVRAWIRTTDRSMYSLRRQPKPRLRDVLRRRPERTESHALPPTPFHTKLAQQRSPLSQYIQQEAVGTRMRRWDRPLYDFLLPYLRGAIGRSREQSSSLARSSIAVTWTR